MRATGWRRLAPLAALAVLAACGLAGLAHEARPPHGKVQRALSAREAPDNAPAAVEAGGTVAGPVVNASFAPAPPTRTDAPVPGAWRALVIGGRRVVWPRASDGSLTLHYAFARGAHHDDGAVNCSAIGPLLSLMQRSRLPQAAVRAAAAQAFARWQAVSNLRFVETENDAAADIVIGAQLAPDGYAFTNVDLGDDLATGARAIRRAAICLNPERHWKIGFDGNLAAYDLVHTLTHEIGHAIGLDHPGARGHVMSFRYDETHAGLTPGDISGIVALYGAPTPYGSPAPAVGDTHALPPTAAHEANSALSRIAGP